MTLARSVRRFVPVLLAPVILLAPVPPALAAGEITVAKDTIRPKMDARGCMMDDKGCKGGDLIAYPGLIAELNGALPSGAQPYVEFRMNGKSIKIDAGSDDVYGIDNRTKIFVTDNHGSENGWVFPGKIPAGTVEFTIGVRNELTESNDVIYQGKFDYEKRLISAGNEETVELLVNDDWRLPIGYLYMTKDRGLHVVTWYRGRPGGVKTFLFRDGVEVAKNEGCGIGDVADFDPTHYMYWEVDCEITGVYGDEESAKNGYEPNINLAANPGNYEFKCLAGGKLARVIKFTVNADGSFDNGIATANQLGSERVIVPVEVKMDNPTWNKAAWKTGAYYGHPLTGFAVPGQP
ncbi:MAG TPA: hypothetical protein VF720_09330 [Candidatus Eisenbacteria bacterium]